MEARASRQGRGSNHLRRQAAGLGAKDSLHFEMHIKQVKYLLLFYNMFVRVHDLDLASCQQPPQSDLTCASRDFVPTETARNQ